MDPNKLTEKSQEAIRDAQALADRRHHQGVDVEHLAVALIAPEDGLARAIISAAGLSPKPILESLEKELAKIPQVSGGGEPYATPRLGRVLRQAEEESKGLKDDFTSVEHLLLALVADSGSTGRLLRAAGLTREKLMEALRKVRGHQRVSSQNPEGTYQSLEKYGRDLTKLASQGKVDPVIGRDEEIRRTIQVLSRRTKNNPVLIGEP
ncbi:MAG: Clp protease N-terminal domain-containing protein, partial [Candidatus Binatia bacterium]